MKIVITPATSNEAMSANYDVIVIFPIYDQFGAIRKPDSISMVCKTYIFITSNIYLTKTENRTKKSPTQLYTIALSKDTIFAKNTDISNVNIYLCNIVN